MALLYLETNFLMSVATGRDPRVNELWGLPPGIPGLVIPDICFIEAIRALEDELTKRKDLIKRLKDQEDDAGRNRSSDSAKALIAHLIQARIEFSVFLADLEGRFGSVTRRLAGRAEFLPLTPGVLLASLDRPLLPGKRRDNLILHAILDHARRYPGIDKAFLSENRNDFGQQSVRGEMEAAGGLRYFSNAGDCLDWLRALERRASEDPPEGLDPQD